MAEASFVWPFVFLYGKVIEEVESGTGCNNTQKPTILALNPDRFRGDLQCLANSGEFRVLKVPFQWQTRVLALFWTKQLRQEFDLVKYYNPEGDPLITKIQYELRSFLRKFLPSLYTHLKVDCVIGAAIHYKQDYDWGLVSDEIGVPYVVLHRENLVTAPGHIKHNHDRFGKMGTFKGSHIIVQNDVMRDVIIRSGFTTAEKTSALGALRMDDYIKRIRRSADRKSANLGQKRKMVVLFSFHHGTGMLGVFQKKNQNVAWAEESDFGWKGLFNHVHTAIAQLAVEHSEVDFVIKPKWGGSWIEKIDSVLLENGIDQSKLGNLTITAEVDAHDLILASDVLCGFGSTALLEAAIAGKPVIVPYFDEVSDPKYADYVQFRNELDIFDVAHSIDDFKELIVRRLSCPDISDDCMERRYAVFEKYVSSMNGDALGKYVRIMKQVIHEKQRCRES